jgi:hypothetical protein
MVTLPYWLLTLLLWFAGMFGVCLMSLCASRGQDDKCDECPAYSLMREWSWTILPPVETNQSGMAVETGVFSDAPLPEWTRDVVGFNQGVEG